MENKKRNILSGVLIVLLIAFVGFYIYTDLNKNAGKIDPVDGVTPASSDGKEEPVEIDMTPGQKDGYKVEVEEVPDTSNVPKLPDLGRKIVDYNHLDPAVVKVMSESMAVLAKDLADDSKNESKWLQLAIYRKTLGDYTAAVEILNYLAILWPNDYVIYNNLADLYQFYIKDYPLAEKNWLKTKELNATYIAAYQNLYTLYFELYKGNESKALPVLLEGLSKNSKSIELMLDIARHYRVARDDNMASVYYKKASSEANAQGNTAMSASIEEEAGNLLK